LSYRRLEAYILLNGDYFLKEKMTIDFDYLSKELEEKFPLFLRPADLIKAGLFTSRFSISHAIRRQNGPPFIRLDSKKVLFPRDQLIKWLKEKHERNDKALRMDHSSPNGE
jgi:hypothetical protein